MRVLKENYGRFLAVGYVTIFSILACEPVFAVGWRELFIVFILILFLVGPTIYRFLRKIESLLKKKDK